MQAFQSDVFSNMFDQWKVYDRMGFMKMWSDGLKSLEKFNLFGNFHNITENEKVSKSFETINDIFNAGMKNVEAFAEASQKTFEKGQEVTKKRMEVYQTTYSDFMTLLKELMHTKNLEHAATKQADYVKKTTENLMTDFRNLTNSLADSNSRIFENLNAKISENIAKHSRQFKEAAATTGSKK